MQAILQDLNALRWMTAAVIIISALALYRRYRVGRPLTAVAGVHASILLAMGVGPFLYTFGENEHERIPFIDQVASLNPVYWYFLLGYAAVTAVDILFPILFPDRIRRLAAPSSTPGIVAAFGLLSVLGSIMGENEFAASGVGTIFPVLRSLLYPSLLIAVVSYRRTLSWTIITGLLVAFVGTTAFFSAWRSGLVLFCVTVSLVVLMTNRRRAWLLIPGMLMVLYFVMPFQIIKREDAEAFTAAKAGETIARSWALPWKERQEMVMDFIATRINTARELAHVQAAVESGALDRRDGDSYWEAIEQLVPRTFWQNKPSFNELTGYYLPRVIGLLGWEDGTSSWAVGLWAEFDWNFEGVYLPIFIAVIFCLAALIDWSADAWFWQPACIWLAHTAFFYLFLAMVSLVYNMTYIVWLMVVLLLIDRFWYYTKRQRQVIRDVWLEAFPLQRS